METKATNATQKKYPHVYDAKDGSKRVEMFLPPGRHSFEHLVEPDKLEDQKPKYKHDVLFAEGEDLSELEKMIDLVGSSKFGKDWPKLKAKSYPLKAGDDKDTEKYPEYAGKRYVSPTTQFKPKLFDESKRELPEGETIPSGYWVRDFVTILPYEMTAKKGVTIALNAVKLVKRDETFGGSGGTKVDANDFPEDAMGDGDDGEEIPF